MEASFLDIVSEVFNSSRFYSIRPVDGGILYFKSFGDVVRYIEKEYHIPDNNTSKLYDWEDYYELRFLEPVEKVFYIIKESFTALGTGGMSNGYY